MVAPGDVRPGHMMLAPDSTNLMAPLSALSLGIMSGYWWSTCRNPALACFVPSYRSKYGNQGPAHSNFFRVFQARHLLCALRGLQQVHCTAGTTQGYSRCTAKARAWPPITSIEVHECNACGSCRSSGPLGVRRMLGCSPAGLGTSLRHEWRRTAACPPAQAAARAPACTLAAFMLSPLDAAAGGRQPHWLR